jgi:predicted N-formylglutamate amidohydrolase
MKDPEFNRQGPPGSLLAEEEPAPVRVLHEQSKSPIVLLCDHASPVIPRAFNNLGLDADTLTRHVAWDIGSPEVALHLAKRLDATVVMTTYSRLVIDVNRRPGHATSTPAVSEDVLIPGNQNLTREHVMERERVFFWPYHNAISATLQRIVDSGRTPTLISLHSFTPVFHGVQRPWDIGVLWHQDGRIAQPLIAGLLAGQSLCIGDNEPYHAGDPMGYTMPVHGEAPGHPHVLIEMRQDRISDAAGAENMAQTLGDVLESTLKNLGIVSNEQYAHE